MGADARVKFQVEKILSGLEDVVPRLRNSELVFRLPIPTTGIDTRSFPGHIIRLIGVVVHPDAGIGVP